jgi:hypothetical protein
MNNNNNSFFDYINNPLSQESIRFLYKSNNIKFEKCELYGDFVQSLMRLIFDTYMGDDITNLDQQIMHFKWCWSKNISNFKEEGIIFKSNDLYSYFLEFMLEVFYTSPNKSFNDNKGILKLWYYIFDYSKGKSNSDMDTLIEIYQIFDESLKK